jgi:DNA-nicking Smr family endonuclease
MARGLRDDDRKLWARVIASVTPLRPVREPDIGAHLPDTMVTPAPSITARTAPLPLTPFRLGDAAPSEPATRVISARRDAPEPIEPNRKRRLSRERDPVEARLDLHGLTAFSAETRVKAFIAQAFHSDYRTVLIITGKGTPEIGVLKRHAPEWLADPALSHMVAGVADAHPRHGGSGALYVALKKRRG